MAKATQILGAQSGNKALRRRLWGRDPHCHWCGRVTRLTFPGQFNSHPARGGTGSKKMPSNLATVDHVYPAQHPKHNTSPKVLACRECNSDRNTITVRVIFPKEFMNYRKSKEVRPTPPRRKYNRQEEEEKRLRIIEQMIKVQDHDQIDQTIIAYYNRVRGEQRQKKLQELAEKKNLEAFTEKINRIDSQERFNDYSEFERKQLRNFEMRLEEIEYFFNCHEYYGRRRNTIKTVQKAAQKGENYVSSCYI